MSEFRGYAQETRTGFDPIKAPDTSKRILEQADQTIRGLQAVRDADVANTAAYLQSFNQTQEAERQSLSNAGKLMDINFEARKSGLELQARQDAERKVLAGKRRDAIYAGLASFSKAAASAVVGFQQQQEQRDYDNEIVRLFTQGYADDKDKENFLADQHDSYSLDLLGVATQARAAAAEANGVDSMAVSEIRQQDAGISVGRKRARLDFFASQYPRYLQQALSNDTETQIKLFGPNGTFIDGTPSQAKSSKDVAFVSQQLLTKYLKENGMHGMKSSFLAPHLLKMRHGVDQIVGSYINNEITAQKQSQVDDIAAAFQSKDQPASKRFHLAYARLQLLQGPQNARETLFNLMKTPQQIVQGVTVGFSDVEVAQILNSSFSDQPGKRLVERFGKEALEIRERRQQSMVNRASAERTANQLAIQQDLERLGNTLLQDYVLDGRLDITDQQIDDLVDSYNLQGSDFAGHVQKLQSFKQFTPEAVDAAPFIEYVEARIKLGMISANQVMDMTMIPWAKRTDYAKQADVTDKTKPSEEEMGRALTIIQENIFDRAKYHNGTIKHPSVGVMVRHAEQRFRENYIGFRQSDRSPSEAFRDAEAQFLANFGDDPNKGKYKLLTDPDDNYRSGVFANFQEYQPKVSDTGFTYKKLRDNVKANPSAIGTKYVREDSIKKVLEQVQRGVKPDMLPNVELIRKHSRKPGGGTYSYAEVFLAQADANNIVIPDNLLSGFKTAVKIEEELPPQYQVYRNFPSAINSDVMLMASGKERMYTRRPESQTNALIQAASTLGIDPVDLATIIGFETKGTYDPNIVGGANNNYKGLIQFGITERKDYGVVPDMSFEEQLLGPVVRYFQDRFAKAGLSTQGATLEDLYTTVIAGNPKANRNAKDAFGTSARSGVALMGDHRQRALRIFFGGDVNNTSFGDSVWQQSQNMNPALVERLSNNN